MPSNPNIKFKLNYSRDPCSCDHIIYDVFLDGEKLFSVLVTSQLK